MTNQWDGYNFNRAFTAAEHEVKCLPRIQKLYQFLGKDQATSKSLAMDAYVYESVE